MKTAILLLTLALSANSFALEITSDHSFTTFRGVEGTVGGVKSLKMEAAKVNNDIQAMVLNGEISDFLNQKIKSIQSDDTNISNSEALDILADEAASILAQ
jgi:hypothetical protein